MKTSLTAPPSSRSSPTGSRRPSASFAGRTAVTRAGLLALAALAGCLTEASGPHLDTARIDYVDGAIEPILVPGASFVVEGFGFGAARDQGSVQFARAGGGQVAAVPYGWTDRAIQAQVPPAGSGATGPLTVLTADGRRLTAQVHVIGTASFTPATLTWQPRAAFPRAPVGVALAAAEYPSGSVLAATLYAAGGAEPLTSGTDITMLPDSGVYIARTLAGSGGGGDIATWTRQHNDLPLPRAFAAAAAATPYNSRFPGNILYVIGGTDLTGRAQASVFAAPVTPDSVAARFVAIEPLPAPRAGAIAVVRRGRIYVIGGADSLGRPQRTVFVGRVGADGHIDGWYLQPALSGPRAYGGGLVLDGRAVALGGIADSVPPGGGLDPATPRLVTSDTAALSVASGFFTSPWGPGPALLPDGRSQFATLDVGNAVLAVGGIYPGAATNSAETIAAAVVGDSVGPFSGPVGTNTIAGLAGGTLVGPAGVTWRDADGTRHGLVLGGMDLATALRRAGVWGF